MFKVLEHDPMLKEIKEHVKNWENKQYPEDVTTDSDTLNETAKYGCLKNYEEK